MQFSTQVHSLSQNQSCNVSQYRCICEGILAYIKITSSVCNHSFYLLVSICVSADIHSVFSAFVWK